VWNAEGGRWRGGGAVASCAYSTQTRAQSTGGIAADVASCVW
jgi:hypothetical protein